MTLSSPFRVAQFFQSAHSSYMALAKNTLINAVVIGIFLYRPFIGVDGEQARFIY